MLEDLSQCNVTIVGLGLMGGSLALALAGKVRHLRGVEASPQAANLALEMGLVEAIIPLREAINSDLIVLAAPVGAILTCLSEMGSLTPARPVVVMDLGSTKARVCSAMETLPASFDPIGGHPMCGREVSGAANADAGLFINKTFVLSRLSRSSAQAERLANLLVQAVGACPIALSPDLHDRLVARSSHLPYLGSVGLVKTAESLHDERFWQVTASGFRDSTRLAGSDLTMMVDILLSNQVEVLQAVEDLQGHLNEIATLVRGGDASALLELLVSARNTRQNHL